MDRRTFLILFSLVLILSVVIFSGWMYLSRDAGEVGGGGNSILNIFPFGDSSINSPEGENLGEDINNDEIYPSPLVREISRTPTSGFTASSSPEGESILYMERESGHIYNAPLAFVTKGRISNTSFPGVEEALWHTNGLRVIARYLSPDLTSIISFSGSISRGEGGDSLEGTLNGSFLKENALFIANGPTNKIFSLYQEEDGAIGIISDFDGKNPTEVFSHKLREWIPQWPSASSVFLTTKASGLTPGFLYRLNITNGSLNKVMGGIDGLTTLGSIDGSKILHSSGGGRPALFIYSQNKSTDLQLATLSEKCAWKKDNITVVCGVPKSFPSGLYPDTWYQGEVSLGDEVWEINTETLRARLIVDPETPAGRALDVYRPELSTDNNYFVFMDKNNLSLWSVRITE